MAEADDPFLRRRYRARHYRCRYALQDGAWMDVEAFISGGDRAIGLKKFEAGEEAAQGDYQMGLGEDAVTEQTKSADKETEETT